MPTVPGLYEPVPRGRRREDEDGRVLRNAAEALPTIPPCARRGTLLPGHVPGIGGILEPLRDRHMYETLQAVLAHRGPDAKAIVWAHNSHVGNAAATEMGWSDEFNIGELCRKRYGEEAILIGMGTDHGTVAAASDWDGPMEIKAVRPSHPDSYERLCLRAGLPNFLIDLRPDGGTEEAIGMLGEPRLERAIGVIYRPETERWSHYFESDLPEQFDAWLWFEETSAVAPLPAGRPHGVPETYPFGV